MWAAEVAARHSADWQATPADLPHTTVTSIRTYLVHLNFCVPRCDRAWNGAFRKDDALAHSDCLDLAGDRSLGGDDAKEINFGGKAFAGSAPYDLPPNRTHIEWGAF